MLFWCWFLIHIYFSYGSFSVSLRKHSERAAINTPLQGGAADVVVNAMLLLHRNERLRQVIACVLFFVDFVVLFFCVWVFVFYRKERMRRGSFFGVVWFFCVFFYVCVIVYCAINTPATARMWWSIAVVLPLSVFFCLSLSSAGAWCCRFMMKWLWKGLRNRKTR